MSKKALLMLPISLMIVATASCSWFSIKRDYTSEYNPSRLLARRNNCDCHYIRYNERDLTGNIVDKVLKDVDYVDEYTLYEGTPELSGTSFELSLNFPSFWVPSYKSITFYENGYAQTGYYDYDKKVSYTYYYEFDKDVAKSICKNVKDEYDRIKEQERLEQEERERVEAEYNQMIEDMTIFTVIEKMKEEERVDLEFSFLTDEEDPRYYCFTFRDDGSIYTSLKNATYSESNHNTYIDKYDFNNHLFIKGNEWKIEIHKNARIVHVTFETHDKYGRSYKYDDDKIIDEDSLNTVLNKAYELSAPKNPFGNSSSNPSSSSEE